MQRRHKDGNGLPTGSHRDRGLDRGQNGYRWTENKPLDNDGFRNSRLPLPVKWVFLPPVWDIYQIHITNPAVPAIADNKRALAATAAIAAVTSTYTQTTYTVTSTVRTTIPATTVTEQGERYTLGPSPWADLS